MQPSFPTSLLYCVIFLAIVVDAWLIFSLERRFRQRNVLKELKAWIVLQWGAFNCALSTGSGDVPSWESIQSTLQKSLFSRLRPQKGLKERLTETLRHPAFQAAFVERPRLFSGFSSLVLIVVLAAIPPLLVIKDRWQAEPVQVPYADWLGSNPLIHLPNYFFLSILCALATLLLVLKRKTRLPVVDTDSLLADATRLVVSAHAAVAVAQRYLALFLFGFAMILFARILWLSLFADHTPGWDMLFAMGLYAAAWLCWDIPVARAMQVWRSFREHASLVFAMLFAHLGIVLFLYAQHTGYLAQRWVFVALAVGSLANLVRYGRKVPIIFWIVSLALVLFAWDVNAWWFSVIGDDYSFYTYAREIAYVHKVGFIGEHLFDGQAVYGSHPYFSSLIQAVFMRLFEPRNFAWCFSNHYLCALAIGFLYLFLKRFTTQRVALWASLFLAGSHYLMSFGKIGYNNLQALFALALVLWLTGRAIREQRLGDFAAVGLGLGFCFYVYPAALYVIPLSLLFLFLYVPPRSKASGWRWAVVGFSFLLLLFPLIVQQEYWQTKVAGTFLYNEQLNATEVLIKHFTRNLIYALISFLYLGTESHYVVVSYVDPFAAFLMLIGFPVLLKHMRSRFAWFLLLGYLWMAFSVGATHDREFPPTTRMFLLLPWLAIFAAFGLEWLYDQLRAVHWPPKWAGAGLWLVVAGMLVTNFYMAYRLGPRYSDRYQVIEQLYLKIAQQADRFSDPVTTVVITGESWGIDGLRIYHDVYNLPDSTGQLQRYVATGATLPPEALPALESPNTVVLFGLGLEDAWIDGLQVDLAQRGKQFCELKTFAGLPRMKLWHAGNLEVLCR
ncbi:MAG: glycosyltransferase family 39 protein [Chloroflexota bacterium]